MRINTIITILLMLFISPNVCFGADENESQSEREYVKLIEEGKTWEYIHRYVFYHNFSLTSFQMRFDGTETRNGVEYNKLVYCGNLTKWNEEDGHPEPVNPYNISFSPNNITDYFLMREDKGKVYLYIKDLADGPLEKIDFDKPGHESVEIGDEAIIYDFTKGPGETIDNVFCNYQSNNTEIYPFSQAMWVIMDLTVKSVSKIDVNGTDLILQDFSYDSYERYSCLEGVGAITSGFLPYLDCSDITPNMTNSYYYLNCLYNADGEIIYKASDADYVDVAELVRLTDVVQPVIGPSIVRSNDEIKAENAVITLFDLSGRMVVSGYETVSTISLQPGVYIAKAESPSGISTLKIRIE